jgi:hypothetical protein
MDMPFVRIDLRKGMNAAYRQDIGRVVYEAMVAAGVREKDRFQVVAEHDADNFLYDPSYLGIERTENLVIIQITWNEGRTVEQKKALYKAHRRRAGEVARHPAAGGRARQPPRGEEGKLVLRQRRRPVCGLRRIASWTPICRPMLKRRQNVARFSC